MLEDRGRNPFSIRSRGKPGPVSTTQTSTNCSVGGLGFDPNGAMEASTIADGLDRVAHQIDQHLLDLQHIHHHGRKVGCLAESRRHICPVEVGLAQFDRLLDESFERERRAVAPIESHQRAKTSDHLGGAIDLRHRLLCDLRNLCGVGVPRARHVGDQAGVGAGRHQEAD